MPTATPTDPLPADTDTAAAPTDPLPPPPSFGKQMAQLVIIPAVIVLVVGGFFLLFGKLVGAKETIDSQLSKLRQSSGAGVMAGGIQDPRYKDRGLAAYNIATMIPGIKAPAERQKLSDALVDILHKSMGPDDESIEAYVVAAIGDLGREGGLDAVLARLESPKPLVRQAAVGGTLAYHAALGERLDAGDTEDSRAAAEAMARVQREALPALRKSLADDDADVRSRAAAALGRLAPRDDADTRAALRTALEGARLDYREGQWNAAIALARMGDPAGADIVTHVLLDRAALAQLPAPPEMSPAAAPGASHARLGADVQDRVILATLASAPAMTDPAVWDKISHLADHDPSRAVQKAARVLLLERERAGGTSPETPSKNGEVKDELAADERG